MAASMSSMLNSRYFLSHIRHCSLPRMNTRTYSNVAEQIDDGETVDYPPIKGRFPPGEWGDLQEKTAWSLYERDRQLSEIRDVKARLESYAGSDEHWFYIMRCNDTKPDTLPFKQFVTKSHILTLPPIKLENIDQNSNFEQIKKLVERDIFLQNNQMISEKQTDENAKHPLLARILQSIMHSLSFSHPYLLSSQVDEDAKIETFWWRTGNKATEKKKGSYFSLLSMQYKDKAKFHIRTEKPTPLFADADADVCKKPTIEFQYSPKSYGQHFSWLRPLTTCGHWIGDPCEFSHFSLYTMGDMFQRYMDLYGLDIVHKMLFTMALSSGFGACVAQAHNQGFHAFRDVTYPFTTQTVAVGGDFLYFCAYQLNTMHLWVDDNANPKGNVAWIDGPHQLFRREADGTVKDYDEKTLKRLVQCLCLEPEDRGVEMRPYAADAGPVETKLQINHKGQPQIERKKIGRFDYPANAVYY